MHQPIRDNLEEYLKGSARQVPQEFHEHLRACGDCANELSLYREHAQMLRSLRAEEEIEPRAGFYARVMDRIEQQGADSIWTVLLQPAFGRRLAMASAALVLLLGTYLYTSERGDSDYSMPQVMMTSRPSAAQASFAQDALQQQQARDAVLVNLAAFRQ